MTFAEKYLAKQNKQFFKGAPLLSELIKLVVVIPCFDEPDLQYTIQSLFSCDKPSEEVAIVVVINDSDQTNAALKKQNQHTFVELETLKNNSTEWLSLHSLYASNLPAKHAGAGWARKIGMDWAISHFKNFNNRDGIIVSLDADALVESNYFEAIFGYYHNFPESIGATIYFEHPIPEGKLGEAIVLYELYMRYYKHILDFTGFPHSLYTIGSCFTIKAFAYVSQGGMNRKKAGEDFYFLHKLMPLGDIGTINDTTVRPSARLSDRVPFGTGPVLTQYIEGDRDLELTYPLNAFLVLKIFFDKIDSFYNCEGLQVEDLTEEQHFKNFLNETNFLDELNLLAANCSSVIVFHKRFFHLFNAFKILKWLNYSVCNGYEKKELRGEAYQLFKVIKGKGLTTSSNIEEMLNLFRYLDKTT